MSYTETKNQIDEQIAELIQNEKIAYEKLKLSYEDLLNAAAHLISQSILPESEKEILTTKIVSEFRIDIANIRRERNKEVARRGGEGKALKDKDGKQQAKNDVKDWWLKWRSSPGMYIDKLLARLTDGTEWASDLQSDLQDNIFHYYEDVDNLSKAA